MRCSRVISSSLRNVRRSPAIALPLQARPDPRRRLRRPEARCSAPRSTRLSRRGRRARTRRASGDPCLPPRPGRAAARRARGRRSRRPPAPQPRRLRKPGAGRCAAAPSSSRAGRCCARRSSSRRPGAAISQRTPRGVFPTFRRSARPTRLALARAAGMPDVEGRALVLLAELALHAESDVPEPTTSPTRPWRSFRSTSWPGSTMPTR